MKYGMQFWSESMAEWKTVKADIQQPACRLGPSLLSPLD